jgi:hypothetical protein
MKRLKRRLVQVLVSEGADPAHVALGAPRPSGAAGRNARCGRSQMAVEHKTR